MCRRLKGKWEREAGPARKKKKKSRLGPEGEKCRFFQPEKERGVISC